MLLQLLLLFSMSLLLFFSSSSPSSYDSDEVTKSVLVCSPRHFGQSCHHGLSTRWHQPARAAYFYKWDLFLLLVQISDSKMGAESDVNETCKFDHSAPVLQNHCVGHHFDQQYLSCWQWYGCCCFCYGHQYHQHPPKLPFFHIIINKLSSKPRCLVTAQTRQHFTSEISKTGWCSLPPLKGNRSAANVDSPQEIIVCFQH